MYRTVLLLMLLNFTVAYKLDLNKCPKRTIGALNYRVCYDIDEYSKIYFHDPTGENQITIIQKRIYKNHGLYVAYFQHPYLFVACERYDKSQWFKNLDNIKTYAIE